MTCRTAPHELLEGFALADLKGRTTPGPADREGKTILAELSDMLLDSEGGRWMPLIKCPHSCRLPAVRATPPSFVLSFLYAYSTNHRRRFASDIRNLRTSVENCKGRRFVSSPALRGVVKGNTFRHGVVVPVHQPDVFLETHPVTLRSLALCER